jgi:hypothetical protein
MMHSEKTIGQILEMLIERYGGLRSDNAAHAEAMGREPELRSNVENGVGNLAGGENLFQQ